MSQFIGIDITKELGKGAYKKAYKAIEIPNESNSLFASNLNIDSLAVVSITFREYKAIKIENIIEELKVQNDYANNEPQLAPQLYLVTIQYGNEFIKNIPIDDFLENGKETFNDFLDANKQTTNAEPKLYFLEELCGPTPGKKQPPLIIDDNFFNKVDELINNLISKSNLLFTDFKPQNTCPQYDASGNLINIMALDLDLKFSYSIDEIKDDLNQMIHQKMDEPIEVSQQIVKDFVKDYMFIQFYYMLLKYATNLKPQNKIFIRNKIMTQLPPEKLLYQLSIFNVIAFMNVLDNTKSITIGHLAYKFPIFKYVFTNDYDNLYEEKYKNKMLYNETKNIDENEEIFTRVVMGQLFERISHILYTYSNNNLLPFTNIVDIVNPPEKLNLSDFNNVPEIDYKQEETEVYIPINKPPTPKKIEYKEENKVDYELDEAGLFGSEGGKRKTKKNRKNRRNKRKSNKNKLTK